MGEPLDLPNTEDWQPRDVAKETLRSAFAKRCLEVERRIDLRVVSERSLNIDNFDSGQGVEDIVREEIGSILPGRYHVTKGVVVDSKGQSAGDVDLVVFNREWFPEVKAGATPGSRRVYLPIEGIYAVGEIKQRVTYQTFDVAMEKLVICHRLHRPQTFARRLVENRESSSCSHGLSNPLYSFVIGATLDPGIQFEDLVNRFYDINKNFQRLEIVRALCILGQGTVVWGFYDKSSQEYRPGLFMLEDLYEPIVPIMHRVPKVVSALGALLENVLLHLFHSVLAPEDIAALYGSQRQDVKVPKSSEIRLDPDPERLASLNVFCDEHEGSL